MKISNLFESERSDAWASVRANIDLTSFDSPVDEDLLREIITERGSKLTFFGEDVWGNIYVWMRDDAIDAYDDEEGTQIVSPLGTGRPITGSDDLLQFTYDVPHKRLLMKFKISSVGKTKLYSYDIDAQDLNQLPKRASGCRTYEDIRPATADDIDVMKIWPPKRTR